MRGVAICGLTGVGKTTAAELIANEMGGIICGTGKICRQISGILFGDETKRNLGIVTDALRTISPSIFLQAALRQITDDQLIIIDSIRYKSDYKVVREAGLLVIRVEAPIEKRSIWLTERKQVFSFIDDANHSSEVDLLSEAADLTIINDSTKSIFYDRIRSALIVNA